MIPAWARCWAPGCEAAALAGETRCESHFKEEVSDGEGILHGTRLSADAGDSEPAAGQDEEREARNDRPLRNLRH